MDDAIGEQEVGEIVAGVRAGRITLGGGPSYSGWRVSVENGRVVRSSWLQDDDGAMRCEVKEIGDEEVAAALRTFGRKVVRRS